MTDVDDAIQLFSKASGRLKVQGNKQLQDALEIIERHATTRGLGPEHIISLVEVAASGKQAETVSKRLVKALIPCGVVPDRAVLICVGWMCTRKPSLNMQILLVRWILVIYNYIDKMDRIHALYGILFHFLHYCKLMPYICHLLYLLTRKDDIKLFRVRMLLQYQKDVGPEPYLTGLLSIYRHYYPSLVHVVLPRTYKNFFRTYDRKWIAQIQQVRDQNGIPGEVNMDWDKTLTDRLYPAGREPDLIPSRKRRKIDPIPVIHSLVTKSSYKQDQLKNGLGLGTLPFSHIDTLKALMDHIEQVESRKRRKIDPIPVIHSLVTKSSYKQDQLKNGLGLGTLPFSHIDTLKALLDHIEQVEFPSQMGAVLRSDIVQHLLSYTKDHVAASRFQFWLGETLEEELIHNQHKPDYKTRVDRLLSLLVKLSDFLQEGVPAVEVVLLEYLPTWNGVDFRPLILQLITRLRFYSFEVLCPSVLEPLKRKFFLSSVYRKCQILMCLTDLLKNYAANEWPRHQELSESSSHLTLFCGHEEEFDGVRSITKYIEFVSRMVLIGMVQEKNNALYEYCVLEFLDLVSSLHQMYDLPFIVLSETLLYERLMVSSLHQMYDLPFIVLSETLLYERLMVSPNPLTVSSVCALMCRFKLSLISLKQLQRSGNIDVRGCPSHTGVTACNNIIIEFSNCLWRGKAFNTDNTHSVFHFDPTKEDKQLASYDLSDSLLVCNNLAFLGYLLDFLKQTEDQENPARHLDSLKDSKREFLQYLASRGLNGLSKFVSTFIRSGRGNGNTTTVSRLSKSGLQERSLNH